MSEQVGLNLVRRTLCKRYQGTTDKYLYFQKIDPNYPFLMLIVIKDGRVKLGKRSAGKSPFVALDFSVNDFWNEYNRKQPNLNQAIKKLQDIFLRFRANAKGFGSLEEMQREIGWQQ